MTEDESSAAEQGFGFAGLPPLEPSADLLTFAQEVRRITLALQQVGYSDSEALTLTLGILPLVGATPGGQE